jgi:hypothetical protein
MGVYSGQITELQLDNAGNQTAWISCPPEAIPDPGQYLVADDSNAVVPANLFLSKRSSNGFLVAPPVPPHWTPGTRLRLRGPLGHGFHIPANARRLALITMTSTSAYLLPLVDQALSADRSVALFTDDPLPPVPLALEVHPLSVLPEFISWADFLAGVLTLEDLPHLRAVFGLAPQDQIPCHAQALVLQPMPCAALAECGVCAIPLRRTWKLACKDGPVFNLNDLDW